MTPRARAIAKDVGVAVADLGGRREPTPVWPDWYDKGDLVYRDLLKVKNGAQQGAALGGQL